MSKKKKHGDKNRQLEKIVLITAIINLLDKLIELLQKLLE